uniref:LAGLIDADG endonuclease n=4 Tax=Fusarium fujikuroi species complex TaxID=171627 RepID=A0A6M4B156_9HYPO|nr:LAGLIDADG endonuclease [Fusarium napiforme]QJQ35191.1 LAGLIDADG endonuclease [Fusarium ramigenum]QJQ35314.1 LAGLIDADG endonuclease [Fusarium brevicatenulatum]QJQ35347.1 LAGLIDADG endonuclease [Fusarium pseudoanthophilum]
MARKCNFTFRHQTICVEIKRLNHFINSQITKALDCLNNQISYNLFNSPLIYWLYKLRFYYLYNSILKSLSVRWKILIISKLVGISEAIRLILIFKKQKISHFFKYSLIYTVIFNYKSTKFFARWLSLNSFKLNNNLEFPQKIIPPKLSHSNANFNEWLAGLIDGDGYFILTKKNYASCEITMDIRDKKVLTEIKQKFGGNIKAVSNSNAVRYKLRHKKGLITLINNVNGLIRNPVRLLQINKLCVKYNIELKYPKDLTYNNGWLSGIIDSDGSVYYSEASGQVFISITQKNKYLLEPLQRIYGGRIDILSPKIEAFKFIIYRKNELISLKNNYFFKYPLKSEKMKRINLIEDFYELRIPKNQELIVNPKKLNEWVVFKDKWEKYKN